MFETLSKITESLTDDILAIGITGTVMYMSIAGIAVPEFLVLAFGAILAFYYKPTGK